MVLFVVVVIGVHVTDTCTQTNLHNKRTCKHSVSPCWVNKHCSIC